MEVFLPKLVTKKRNLIFSCLFFLWAKSPAEERVGLEHIEEIGRDSHGRHALGAAIPGQRIISSPVERREAVKNGVL